MERLAWYKEPLLHFFLIGILMFVAYGMVNPGEEEEVVAELIVEVPVRAHVLEQIASARADELGRFPGPEELAELFQDHLRMEVLYTDAVSMELDQTDIGVRRQLARRLAFMIQGEPGNTQPTEEQLKKLFESQRADYEVPAQMSLRHVYFSRELRGEKALEDARGLLEKLLSLPDPREADLDQGDPFSGEVDRVGMNAWQLEDVFGKAFTEAALNLETGRWSGPIESDEGQHLVLVTDKKVPHLPELGEVIERVRADWYTEVNRKCRQSQDFSAYVASCDFTFDAEAATLLAEYGVEQSTVLP